MSTREQNVRAIARAYDVPVDLVDSQYRPYLRDRIRLRWVQFRDWVWSWFDDR